MVDPDAPANLFVYPAATDRGGCKTPLGAIVLSTAESILYASCNADTQGLLG